MSLIFFNQNCPLTRMMIECHSSKTKGALFTQEHGHVVQLYSFLHLTLFQLSFGTDAHSTNLQFHVRRDAEYYVGWKAAFKAVPTGLIWFKLDVLPRWCHMPIFLPAHTTSARALSVFSTVQGEIRCAGNTFKLVGSNIPSLL